MLQPEIYYEPSDFAYFMKKDSLCFYLSVLSAFFLLQQVQAQSLTLAQQKQADEYRIAIAKYRATGDLAAQASQLNKLAYLCWENNLLPQAASAFEELLSLQEKAANKQAVAVIYSNLGTIYKDQGKYAQALDFFRNCLERQQADGKPAEIYATLSDIAQIQGYLHRPQEAVHTVEQALGIALSLNDIKRTGDSYARLAEHYKALGNAVQSNRYYQLYTLLLNKTQQHQLDLDKQRMAFMEEQKRRTEPVTLSTAERLRNTEQELEQDKKKLREQAEQSEKQKMEIALLNQQKQLLNKEKQIEELKLKTEEENLKDEQFRSSLLLGVAIVVGGMAFFLFRDVRKIRRLNTQLVSQNHEISEQKEEISQQNSRLDLSQRSLLDAKIIIQEQNLKLQAYNRDLEKQVDERTAALQKAYSELLLINNDLDTLTYRASHDLKSPVASLDGLCNVALLEIPADNPAGFYFTRIKEIAGNMAALLDSLARLRDIKHTSLHITEFSVRKLVEEVIKTESRYLPEAANIRFDNQLPEALLLKTDALLYRLILRNVLQNAVQFSLPPTAQHQPFVNISGENTATFNEIRITDNGEGIPVEIAPKIFNMFYRGSVRSKGAGLGLYACRAAIEKLGGTVEFSRNALQQTVFTIRLFNAQKAAPDLDLEFLPKISTFGEFSA